MSGTDDRVTVVFAMTVRGECHDIEIPLSITANELLLALREAYGLKIDLSDRDKYCLKAENPIALLKGGRTLEEFGIRKGTIIYFTDREDADHGVQLQAYHLKRQDL